MKVIFHGPAGIGDVSAQRAEALDRIADLEVVRSPLQAPKNGWVRSIFRRLAWRARIPFDSSGENAQLERLASLERPDAIIVYNSRALRASTLRRIRQKTGATLVYIAPDDIIASHNRTRWLTATFPVWDILFTSKTYNVPELRGEGVRNPVLNENIFDPSVHRPMTKEEVGDEFESFDVVFVGTFEADREVSLRKLAEAGLSVLVCGNAAGLLSGGWDRLKKAGVEVRPAAVDAEYTRAVHKGKVPLGFLRKINRDQITHRSIELPAMGRAMLAEKTVEHDAHFVDGAEYVGFSSDEEMIGKARALVANRDRRREIGKAARARCLASGYDVDADMARILKHIWIFREAGQ